MLQLAPTVVPAWFWYTLYRESKKRHAVAVALAQLHRTHGRGLRSLAVRLLAPTGPGEDAGVFPPLEVIRVLESSAAALPAPPGASDGDTEHGRGEAAKALPAAAAAGATEGEYDAAADGLEEEELQLQRIENLLGEGYTVALRWDDGSSGQSTDGGTPAAAGRTGELRPQHGSEFATPSAADEGGDGFKGRSGLLRSVLKRGGKVEEEGSTSHPKAAADAIERLFGAIPAHGQQQQQQPSRQQTVRSPLGGGGGSAPALAAAPAGPGSSSAALRITGSPRVRKLGAFILASELTALVGTPRGQKEDASSIAARERAHQRPARLLMTAGERALEAHMRRAALSTRLDKEKADPRRTYMNNFVVTVICTVRASLEMRCDSRVHLPHSSANPNPAAAWQGCAHILHK